MFDILPLYPDIPKNEKSNNNFTVEHPIKSEKNISIFTLQIIIQWHAYLRTHQMCYLGGLCKYGRIIMNTIIIIVVNK